MKIHRFFRILQSVVAALLGVQKQKKAEEDFEQGGIGWYLFAGTGFLFFILFVLIKLVRHVSAS